MTLPVGGLVWFGLMLNIPVNNFSVMLGQSHRNYSENHSVKFYNV